MNVLIAFALDSVFADPTWLPHPVVLMGKLIAWEYKGILKSPSGWKKLLGIGCAVFNTIAVFLLIRGLLALLSEPAKTVVTIYLLYTALAARTLHKEAQGVKKALSISLEKGRKQLSRIVGRDTASLTEEEIIKATVETVAENTSDGIIAPLFYGCLFGPAGAMAYKMINTMDSMVGYKNETYALAGYGAAKLDDAVNFVPARITAFFMCLTAGSPERIKRAFETVRMYHDAHLSPNAGWCEAAAAGILGIELGGGHNYFGEYVYKPTIGRALRPVKRDDVDGATKIMWRSTILYLLIYIGLEGIF
ncbi:MAG: adenosylcobinamide-phosphate synthase CbiB [Peptoniphilus sp.]|nr:adenosylcobinamide-phosphate synthase CbiB [Peptoniphilus sp.]MDY3118575.1 adenosylcobinamide-phosphate synthase CbiB [Peptoniphilus sp.]